MRLSLRFGNNDVIIGAFILFFVFFVNEQKRLHCFTVADFFLVYKLLFGTDHARLRRFWLECQCYKSHRRLDFGCKGNDEIDCHLHDFASYTNSRIASPNSDWNDQIQIGQLSMVPKSDWKRDLDSHFPAKLATEFSMKQKKKRPCTTVLSERRLSNNSINATCIRKFDKLLKRQPTTKKKKKERKRAGNQGCTLIIRVAAEVNAQSRWKVVLQFEHSLIKWEDRSWRADRKLPGENFNNN